MLYDEYRICFRTSCGGSVALDPEPINQKFGILAPGKDNTNVKKLIADEAQQRVREKYLAIQFFLSSNFRWYGKLVEEVENSFTGGNKNS